MAASNMNRAHDYIFYGFLPWFLVRLGSGLGLGAACLAAAIVSAQPWWLAGLGIALAASCYQVLAYNNTAVLVRGSDLVLRRGALLMREVSLPVWQTEITIEQSLAGRLFNYGTVTVATRSEVIRLRAIAAVSILRRQVTARRNLAPANGPYLLPAQTGVTLQQGHARQTARQNVTRRHP